MALRPNLFVTVYTNTLYLPESSYLHYILLSTQLYLHIYYLYLQVVWDCGPWGARLTARPDHSACSGLEAAGYSVEEQLQRLAGGEEMPEQVLAYIMIIYLLSK